MSRLRRFMATPLAVILLFVVITLWTWVTLGWLVAWKLAALLTSLGITDLVLGWQKGRTLSEEVNQSWHKSPWRYRLWLVGVAASLVLLHLHFTGV